MSKSITACNYKQVIVPRIELPAIVWNPRNLETDHCKISVRAQVVDAVKSGNHARFFELFRDAPRMSPYLMDAVADKVRYPPRNIGPHARTSTEVWVVVACWGP